MWCVVRVGVHVLRFVALIFIEVLCVVEITRLVCACEWD